RGEGARVRGEPGGAARGGVWGRRPRGGADSPGPGGEADPAAPPRLDRAGGIRLPPPRHRQPPGLPGRPHRTDAGRGPGAERRGELSAGPGGIPPPAPSPPRRLPDPRRRPEPHRPGDGGILRRMPRLVAPPADPGTGVVAGPGRVADPCLRRPLLEAELLARSRELHPARDGLLARVQRALRPPVPVDMDQPEDAELVRKASELNFGRDFVPGTLG